MICNEIHIRSLFHRSYVRMMNESDVNISPNAIISNSKIFIYPGAKLTIENNACIDNACISVVTGSLVIGKSTIIQGSKDNKVQITIDSGVVAVADHVRLSCHRIWVRFGGKLCVGSYTNINGGSEVRCDESVEIGSFNQISYNVRIWDTNTHSILPGNERRKLTEDYFPYFGKETERPKTAPVIIGDDCWIGERSAIMKGTSLGDSVIVGFDTFISGKNIPSQSRVINKRELSITTL